MNTSAASTPTKSICVEYDLPHVPAKVSRALTESALLGAWPMPNDVGHRFTFKAPPTPGFDITGRGWHGKMVDRFNEVLARMGLRIG